jgi:hypothetical protein
MCSFSIARLLIFFAFSSSLLEQHAFTNPEMAPANIPQYYPSSSSAGLQGQFAIMNPEMAPASIPQSFLGEADPRMELLRLNLGFDIKTIAGMSREQAFKILTSGLPASKLKELINTGVTVGQLVELINTGVTVDQLLELINTGVTVDELVDMIDSGLPVDLISDAGFLASQLLQDTTIDSDPLDEDRIFTRGRLMSSRYSTEVVNEVVKLVATHSGNESIAENIVNAIASGTLNSPSQYIGELVDTINDSKNTNLLGARQFHSVGNVFGLTTDDFTAYAGKNVTIEGGSNVDVKKWIGKDAQYPNKTKVLAFVAGGDMRIEGDVTFTNGGHEVMDHALAVGAADDLEIAAGSTVKYDGSNFGLGAGKSIRIVRVSLETQDHLGLGTLDDLIIEDSTIRVGPGRRTFLYAQNKMDVDGLDFSSDIGQVYMEATTIDLRNVDFPSGSEVLLVSELGAKNGYPNFGPSERGRVNFIDAVSYGGRANIMNDKSSFDQHGAKVSIKSFE